ncbi:ABC-three component system protein [Burkholderia aenigmatica]|uniref:ABC-three component system protein n=1 Tax=Burkholderia aenigmatica TaxID=2015348 RepID=UPI0026539F16|nr:ABC-three component system protein [Burkholderia aenigmatica]MDN7877755.1 hypothetical protein [Burkholderia aenigmatica]
MAAKYKINPSGFAPSRLVLLFTPEEWEQFVEECCLCNSGVGKEYTSVRRLGGPGDAGRDIEARLCEPRAKGKWDLFQGKHYQSTVSRSQFYPELAKFFRHILIGTYPEPRAYFLCAPKNAGPELFDLMSEPLRMKADFLDAAQKGEAGLKDVKPTIDAALLALVNQFDFSKIREFQIRDLLTLHAENAAAHFKRFGIEPVRGDDPNAPSVPAKEEDVYIRQLIDAYGEHAGHPLTIFEVQAADAYSEHFQGCREEFYCAEGLRRFSRDVFVGEFEKLMSGVHTGIKRAIASPSVKTGLDRLDKALSLAGTLNVSDNPLANRLRPGDLPGTCHHLANEERVKWVK